MIERPINLIARTLATLFFGTFVCMVPANAQEQKRQPNIIVIMGDDHARWAVGAYGNPLVETPNMDWMARKGVKFTNAFSPAPVCSPSRASFYTGKMPSQHGVHDFLAETQDFDANWLANEKLLSEYLQTAGYRVGLFGKWHATTNSALPQRGFDRWLSYDALNAGWKNQYLHRGTVHFSRDGKPLEFTGVQARFLTENAVAFMDETPDQPFFISLNFVEPHAPFEGLPERLVGKYREKAMDLVRAGATSDLQDRGPNTRTPSDHAEKLAQYLAAVSLIDEQIGRILDALEGRGMLEDSIVVYTSDHGMLVGQYGLYGKTNATNPPNFYQETIRIPLVVYGADKWLRPMQDRSEFVDLIDLHATIRAWAAGEEKPDANYGPGRSFLPLLAGERSTGWRTMQFAERGNSRMATDGRWKLVRRYQRDAAAAPIDLWYDLAHPLGEKQASIPPRQQVQDKITDELERFFRQYETEQNSGRTIWTQPPANARMAADLEKQD